MSLNSYLFKKIFLFIYMTFSLAFSSMLHKGSIISSLNSNDIFIKLVHPSLKVFNFITIFHIV